MKDGKYEYRIEINEAVTASNIKPFTYKFGRTENITLQIKKNAALITFAMTVKKDFMDFTNPKNLLFRDAMRKAYLYHAFKFNKGLPVKSITIYIEGETKVFDDKTPYFPFLQSLISTEALGLSDNWKHDDFCKKVLAYKTSEAYEDLKLSAIYSYLASKSKEHQIDRFSCLWTAMNAFYNFYDYCITNQINKGPQDNKNICNLMKALGCGEELPQKSIVQNTYQIKDTDAYKHLKLLYIRAGSYIAKLDFNQELYEQYCKKKRQNQKAAKFRKLYRRT